MNFKNETGNRTTKIASFLLMTMCLLFFPVMVAAQAVSGVTGVVTDASGAVVPGVQVILADTNTSREFTTTTNNDGVYIFNNVQPGDAYRLTLTGQGFQTFILNDVTLGVGRTETQNIQLTAGQVSETVQVTSTTGDATLNTTDASIGNVIGERQLRELPIQFRGSPAALLSLQPGVVGNNIGASTANDNRVGSVTGSRTDQGNITVDGLDQNDQTGGFAFSTVAGAPIDSVQEFRAISANPGATEGRSSGGQIIIATKGGTNEFHGSLREYYRDERTAANNFFNNATGVVRPKLRRHQFGGSIGGPLPFFNFGEGGPLFNPGRDKLFFFFDYEGRRDNSESAQVRNVPLQSFREGRIGYIRATDAVTGATCAATSRRDTTPNCIGELTLAQAQALDPAGIGINQAFLTFINNRYPVANDLAGGNGINTGLFRFNAPVTQNINIYTGRIDWNATSRQKLFFRTTINRTNATQVVQLFPGDPESPFVGEDMAFVGGHSWVITPKLFNQLTIGLTQQYNSFPAPESPAFPTQFNGGAGLDIPFTGLSAQDRTVNVPVFRDDATYTTGAHTFQFGGQFKPIRQTPGLTSDFNTVTFGIGGNLTGLTTGAGVPSLRPANIRAGSTAAFDAAFAYLLGRYASISTAFVYDPQGNPSAPGSGRQRDYAYNETELYVQDNWKIRSDLTVNLGVRWHLYPAPYETRGFQTGPNITTYEEFFEQRVANNAAGIAGAAAEPFLTIGLIGKANDARALYNTDWNNFAPRVGFAYNPSFRSGFLGAVFGDRKTVIRGGASKTYDRVSGAVTFLADQFTFIFDNRTATNFGSTDPRASLLNDPRFQSITTLPIQNVAPAVTNPITPFVTNGVGVGTRTGTGQTNYTVDENFEIPYSYQWSFGMQREIPGNMIIDVSYVGRMGRNLIGIADISQTLNFKDNASGQFMFDAFNAVQTEIQTQLAAGVVTPVVTAQPWIENQVRLGANVPNCGTAQQPTRTCTQFVANSFQSLLRVGGTADLVQQMYTAGLLRPNVGISSQFASNRYVANLGESDYHGMLLSVQKRFSKGFEFDFNYTWSHAIDNNSSVTNSGTGPVIADLLDPNNTRADADFDIRHLFNANGIWDLPFGRGRALGNDMPKWLDAFVGGWTISGIFAARSGQAFSPASGAFPVSFVYSSPAVLVGNDQSVFDSNPSDVTGGIQYFADPAAAQAALRFPRHGEIGTRNVLRGPGFWNIDAALSKKFRMPWSENHRITVRAEAYNLTNSVNFSLPSITLNTTTFGRITSTANAARVMQFAVRYDF